MSTRDSIKLTTVLFELLDGEYHSIRRVTLNSIRRVTLNGRGMWVEMMDGEVYKVEAIRASRRERVALRNEVDE